MRKVITMLLAVLLVLSLAACGSGGTTTNSPAPSQAKEDSSASSTTSTPSTPDQTEPLSSEPTSEIKAIPLSVGDKIENDSFIMTFESFEVLPEFRYSYGENISTYLYVEDGYQLALLRGHFENTSTSTINSISFSCIFTVNDTFVKDGFDVDLHFLRGTYFEIDPYTDYDYCIYINIPNKLAEQAEKAAVTIGFNNDLSSPTFYWNEDGTKIVETDMLYEIIGEITNANTSGNGSDGGDGEYTIIEEGQTITTDNFEFTLNDVELTYEVKPINTSSVYTSYPADSGKVYIHIDGDYYNTSKRDVIIRDLPVAAADYDDGYKYSGFVIIDRNDNSFSYASSTVACTPLETCHYHCLIDCPEVVDESDAPLFITIKLGETVYRYDIR